MTADSAAPPSRLGARLRLFLEWFAVLLVAVLVATGTRAYAVGSYFIPSGSMTPTLMEGDRILVDKLSGSPHAGDIVVFRRVPADTGGPPILVKRVVGLPGQLISGSASHVLINGKPLAQPWLPRLTRLCADPSPAIIPTRISPGQYFMMGDCRGDSDDSRYWGTVPSSNIVGTVMTVVWRHGHPWLHLL